MLVRDAIAVRVLYRVKREKWSCLIGSGVVLSLDM